MNRPLWLWLCIGVLGYLALPWYAQQDTNGLLAVGQVFRRSRLPTASCRPWRLAALAVAGADRPGRGRSGIAHASGRRQGAVLLLGGGLGLLGLLVSGFAIGARGWAWEWVAQSWGELGARQPGMGWGAFLALAALLVLAAFGLARRGFSRAICSWPPRCCAAAVCSRCSSCSRCSRP